MGRLWGRSASTSSEPAKAKKAHLGEETAFYYDKELKRWVNKKVSEGKHARKERGDSDIARLIVQAGDTGTASTPPPPPPRAQTTSPAMQPDRGTGASSAPPLRRSSGESMRGGAGGPPPPPMGRMGGAGYAGRATPPISEGAEEGSSGLAPPRGLTRARSNLADHSMPAASQPPMRPGSATPMGGDFGPPPPAGGSRTGTVKKRPIKSRYVVVD